MSDFAEIQERLDYSPVVQDTTQNVKPLSFTGVRDIKKLRQQIVIPAYTFDPHTIENDNLPYPLIVYQYNYTVSQAFRISNQDSIISKIGLSIDKYTNGVINPMMGCAVFLRYRIGLTVTRIYIGCGASSLFPSFLGLPSKQYIRNLIQFEDLSNQKIPVNFSVEIWYFTAFLITLPGYPYAYNGLKDPVYINTSITRNPINADDNSPDLIYPISTINYAGLSSTLPEHLPLTVDAKGPWISN
jgi:hypothetical protein